MAYLNRFIAFTTILLQPSNWRPVYIVSLLISQKIWDDRSLDNSDFASLYPFFTEQELISLQKRFIKLIEYNVQVSPTLYTTYYLALREHYIAIEDQFPLEPLQKDDLGLL
jgi:hypothetical protein